jgi:hypothetical protein
MLLGRILRDLNALLIAASCPLFCLRLSLSLSSFSVYQGFPLEYINLLTFVSIYVIALQKELLAKKNRFWGKSNCVPVSNLS